MAIPESPINQNAHSETGKNQQVWRFNPVLTAIYILGAALLGWSISLIPDMPYIRIASGLCTGILTAVFLLTNANAGSSRSAMVIRATSWFTFITSILIMVLMSIFCTTAEYFIMVSALVALSYLAVIYSVARTGQ